MDFGGSRGQSVNGNHTSSTNSTILGWDVWELNNNHNTNNNSNTSRSMDWTSASTASAGTAAFYGSGAAAAESSSILSARADAALALNPPLGCGGEAAVAVHAHQQQSLYGGDGAHHAHPDPHLVCLKLGKRHYFEDHVAAAMAAAAAAEGERRVAGFPVGMKRGKGSGGGGGGSSSNMYGGGSAAAVPRCQVEGCHVALVNAKDYHRRHKVCEMHSKAPKVVVLGLEQRFCQQCSRFHVVSEFEETKRSCKRRLAGHNERRRKSSNDHSIARNSSHHENKVVTMGGGFPYMVSSPTATGRALSLLSSKTDISNNWVPPNSDLSLRSSAALRELIAENRAAILARQLVLESKDGWHASRQHQHHHYPHNHLAAEDFGASTSSIESNQHQMFLELPPPPPPQDNLERVSEGGGGGEHLTLDLMQAPSPAFGFLPGARARAKADEENCCDLWSSF